jgi:hypothetical protein
MRVTGAVFFDQAPGFERRHPGHADIEKHQVGAVLQHQLERFSGIAGFSHHGKVGSVFQQAAHAVAQHFVIVGDHATNGSAASGRNGPDFVVNMKKSSRTQTKWGEIANPGWSATTGTKVNQGLLLLYPHLPIIFEAKKVSARIQKNPAKIKES